MKMRFAILLVLPLALVLVSCPMPGSLQSIGVPTAAAPTAETASFSLEQDSARGVAVFADGTGSRVDVEATEEDGSTVACVDGFGAVALTDDTSAKGLWRHTVLVAGTRDDGRPGLWVITSDNQVQPVIDEETGRLGTCLPESDEKDGTFRGRFGWVYHIMGVSGDGRLVAGYAENPRGFSRGRWKIEAGTTVGVYWRVFKHPARPYFVVSHARIIGTFELPKPIARGAGGHGGWRHGRFSHWFELLHQFLLDYLSSYLVMVDRDGVTADAATGAYLVSGTDQDGEAAVATIESTGKITIEPASHPSDEVDLAPGSLSVSPGVLPDGASPSVSLVVQNLQPGAETAAFDVDFHLCLTGTFSPASDPKVGSVTWSAGIAGSSSASLSTQLSIPDGLDLNGAVSIYAVVDSGATVTETDETNNVSAVDSAAAVLVYDDEATAPRSYLVRLETYAPTGSGTTDTVLALYKADASGTAVSYVAADTSGGSDYSVLDFTAGGLGPGTYYAMVTSWSGRNGPYAFTVRTDNIALRRFANLPSNTVDPGETDDLPRVTSVMANTTAPSAPVAITVGTALNRYSAAGDWDWFMFTLP
jgi:hypothetical protein